MHFSSTSLRGDPGPHVGELETLWEFCNKFGTPLWGKCADFASGERRLGASCVKAQLMKDYWVEQGVCLNPSVIFSLHEIDYLSNNYFL